MKEVKTVSMSHGARIVVYELGGRNLRRFRAVVHHDEGVLGRSDFFETPEEAVADLPALIRSAKMARSSSTTCQQLTSELLLPHNPKKSVGAVGTGAEL